MAKEELIEMNGVVDEILPDSRYRVTLDNGHKLVAYTGGKMKKSYSHSGWRQSDVRTITLRY